MRVYNATEWQDSTGQWLVNDTTSMTSIAFNWWCPMRMLNLSVEEYYHLLADTYHATIHHYNPEYNVLIFTFDTQNDAKAFKNYLNKTAKKINFLVD